MIATSEASRRGNAMDPEESRVYEEELLFGEATETLFDLVKSAGLTQKELARRLEVSPGRVSQILSGGANLTLRTLAACAWALGVRFRLLPAALAQRSETAAAEDPPLPGWIGQIENQVAWSHRLVKRDRDRVLEAPPAWFQFSIQKNGTRRAA